MTSIMKLYSWRGGRRRAAGFLNLEKYDVILIKTSPTDIKNYCTQLMDSIIFEQSVGSLFLTG